MAEPDQAPELVTEAPTGPITRAREPIPVLAVVHWAPPWGDGALPVDGLALAWTSTQGLVQVAWLGGPVEVWVPAGDIHRVHQLAEPVDVVARLQTPSGLVDVPARAHAHATSRAGDPQIPLDLDHGESDLDVDPTPITDLGLQRDVQVLLGETETAGQQQLAHVRLHGRLAPDPAAVGQSAQQLQSRFVLRHGAHRIHHILVSTTPSAQA